MHVSSYSYESGSHTCRAHPLVSVKIHTFETLNTKEGILIQIKYDY